MKINKSDGSIAIFSLSDVQKITFNFTSVSSNDIKKLNGLLRPLVLMQNQPNLFNPSRSITYQLLKESVSS